MAIVDRAYVKVDGASVPCSQVQVKATRNVQRADVMNRNRRSIGVRTGNIHYQLTCDVEIEEGDRNPDWHALQESRQLVTVVLEFSDGKKDTYSGGCVVDVSETFSSEGGGPLHVTIEALNRRRS